MATLQKFKLLATQCAVAGSPTRSPSASPVIHLRRRRTLRMLLSRRRDDRPDHRRTPQPSNSPEIRTPAAAAAGSLKLKDFLLSSSPSPPHRAAERVSERIGSDRARVSVPRGRPFTATLRQKLLRKSWRPVLVSIPE